MGETGSTWELHVGDRIMVTQDGTEREFEVTDRVAPGSLGRSFAAGPSITARLVGGVGYSVTFDDHATKTWRRLTSKELGERIEAKLAEFDEMKKGA